jgi:myo-inositol 2-dehydrogenase/D-chiro-inositol 1-dehydrogenase/scyllo-inositol 2-dehydrogenase (NAD+)
MKSWRNLFAEAYLAEDLNFVTSILEGRPPLVSGVDGKMVVKVVQAGNTSILEKRIVHLE